MLQIPQLELLGRMCGSARYGWLICRTVGADCKETAFPDGSEVQYSASAPGEADPPSGAVGRFRALISMRFSSRFGGRGSSPGAPGPIRVLVWWWILLCTVSSLTWASEAPLGLAAGQVPPTPVVTLGFEPIAEGVDAVPQFPSELQNQPFANPPAAIWQAGIDQAPAFPGPLPQSDPAFTPPQPFDWNPPPLAPELSPYGGMDSRYGGTISPGWLEEDLILMPTGLLYKPTIAGMKQSRFSGTWLWEKDRGLIWETALGGRVGFLRYGTPHVLGGEGWQLDLEGAAFTRIDPEENSDVEAVDFRVGVMMTWRRGPWAWQGGYYHISSHVGDEFLIRNPGFVRYNYVRDSLLTSVSYDVTPDLRLYGEMGYSIGHQGGALPLEFQVGAEYTPVEPCGLRGAPFIAGNFHTREDFGWTSSINTLAGWQWRGDQSQRALRIGGQFYSGPSMQYSFLNRYERLVGVGLWFDY